MSLNIISISCLELKKLCSIKTSTERYRKIQILNPKSKELQDPSLMQIEDIPEGFTDINMKKSDVRQKSLISQNFFGSFTQYLSFTQEGATIVEEENGEFGPLILDLSCKELYSSLERYTEAFIEGYRTPKGEITTAKNNIWLKTLPESIFFQLQRVDFDKESGNPVKKNDPFTFEKEIYLDRFLLSNREEATHINNEISTLRAKLSHQVEALDKISNYLNSQLDIIRVLSIGSDFLKNQINSTTTASDPTVLGDLGDKNKVNSALSVLEEYKAMLEKTTVELKEGIEVIKKQIHELNCKLCKHKYHLVSVLIHDGHAGSGHYYSFNRNVKTDTWKKYNDIQITEEKEELVFKESFGGYANVSAYCLVYMSDAQIQADLEASKAFEAIEVELPVEKIHYQAFLTPKLIDEVDADNCVFKEEIEEYKFSSYLKTITDTYKTRFDHLEKELKNIEPKKPPKDLDTFGAFLKKDTANEKFFKWYIVDTVLRDSQQKMSLKELKNSPKLRLLENRLNSLSKPYGFSQLKYDQADETKFETKYAEFQTSYPILIHCKYLLQAALSENWLDVCYNAKNILDLEKNQASFNYKFLKDCIKTLVLKVALAIERDATGGKIDSAIQQIQYLTAMMKGTLTSDDPFYDQVRIILMDTQNKAKEVIDEDSYQKLKQECYKYSTAQFNLSELAKVVKEYKQKEVEEELEAARAADLYNWREINESSPSAQTAKLMNEFIESVNQKIIPFRTKIGKDKPRLKYEDRRKEGFYYDLNEIVTEKKEEST